MNATEETLNLQDESFWLHVLGPSFKERPSLEAVQEFLISSRVQYDGSQVVRDVAAELKIVVKDANLLFSKAPASESARRKWQKKRMEALERRSHIQYSNPAELRTEAHTRLLSICLVHKQLLDGEFGEFLFAPEYLPRTVKTAVRMLDERISKKACGFLFENLEKIAENYGNGESDRKCDLAYDLMGPLLKSEDKKIKLRASELLIGLSRLSESATKTVSCHLIGGLISDHVGQEARELNPHVRETLLALVRVHGKDEERIRYIVKTLGQQFNRERGPEEAVWQMHELMMDVAATGCFANKFVSETYAYGISRGRISNNKPLRRRMLNDGCDRLAGGAHPKIVTYALFKDLAIMDEKRAAWMTGKLQHIARTKPEETFECIRNWTWDQDARVNFDRRPYFAQLLAEVAPFMPTKVLEFADKPADHWKDFDFTEVRFAANAARERLRHPGEAMPVPALSARTPANGVKTGIVR